MAINVYFLFRPPARITEIFSSTILIVATSTVILRGECARPAARWNTSTRRTPDRGWLSSKLLGPADLQGTPFLNSWHTDSFWRALQKSQSPEDDRNLMRGLGIDYFVAPASPVKRVYTGPFLERFTEPEYTFAGYSAYRWKAIASPPQPPPSAAKGDYDDLNPSVPISWRLDARHALRQAGGRNAHILQPEGRVGDILLHGKDRNARIYKSSESRPRSAITIDGINEVVLDQYDAETRWLSRWKVSVFTAGEHQLKIRGPRRKERGIVRRLCRYRQVHRRMIVKR